MTTEKMRRWHRRWSWHKVRGFGCGVGRGGVERRAGGKGGGGGDDEEEEKADEETVA